MQDMRGLSVNGGREGGGLVALRKTGGVEIQDSMDRPAV